MLGGQRRAGRDSPSKHRSLQLPGGREAWSTYHEKWWVALFSTELRRKVSSKWVAQAINSSDNDQDFSLQ